MAHLKAQVVLQGASNKPEDVFVNTFHFQSASVDIGAAEVIRDHLVELYNVPGTAGFPTAVAISSFLGGVVQRGAGQARIKVYNMADASPRVPLGDFTWTVGGIGSGYVRDLPAEVAMVCSFYAGQNRPRYRGRVYLGPFGDQASAVVTQSRVGPSPTLQQSVAGAFARLINKGANTQNLAVYSTIDNVAREVTAGWCDDAWDTQRRRGQDAANRVLFT